MGAMRVARRDATLYLLLGKNAGGKGSRRHLAWLWFLWTEGEIFIPRWANLREPCGPDSIGLCVDRVCLLRRPERLPR